MELRDFVKRRGVDILALQETKLSKNRHVSIPGYDILRLDRSNKGGGLAFFLRKDLLVADTSSSVRALLPRHQLTTTEIQSCKITTRAGELNLINVYIPPASSCPAGFLPTLAPLASVPNVILMGDFNAHHGMWSRGTPDVRGDHLVNELETLYVLNDDDVPTRSMVHGSQCPASPDITFCSNNIALDLSWDVVADLSSDHDPIMISVLTAESPPTSSRSYANYKKADWPLFTAKLEAALSDFDVENFSHVNKAEECFRRALIGASRDSIPRGSVKSFNPNFSPEIKGLIAQRNALKAGRPLTLDAIAAIRNCTLKLQDIIRDRQAANWKQFLDKLDPRTQSCKFWRAIRNIHKSFNPPETSLPEITFRNGKVPTRAEQASRLVHHYATISHVPANMEDRRTRREIKRIVIDPDCPPPFSDEGVQQVISSLKNTGAVGPDGISNFQLKHMGKNAINALTQIFNFIWTRGGIPAIWKRSHIIPILKKGKPASLPSSYRPISLLCNSSKVLERLVLPRILPFMKPSPSQHGFRAGHSTTTHLTTLVNSITSGFNERKPPSRTVMVALDISKAFDSVPRFPLISMILKTSMHQNDKRYLSDFLSDRFGSVVLENTNSSFRLFKDGVPQGAVLSPSLFNFYVSDPPNPPPGVDPLTYADDFIASSKHSSIPAATAALQIYINDLAMWLEHKRLNLSAPKSSVTLFSPDPHEYNEHPSLMIDKKPLPLQQFPKVLGVTLDPQMSMRWHCREIMAQVSGKTNALRAVASIHHGIQKEDLAILYRQYLRPHVGYASPAWLPLASDTGISGIQRVQNTCLRLVTGCTRMTSVADLHRESKVLPIKDHLFMVGAQSFASSLHSGHTLNFLHLIPPPPRRMKTSTVDFFGRILPPYDPDHDPALPALKANIHTSVAGDYILSLGPAKLLGIIPPEIDALELGLSRDSRVHLARLRSGYHPSLRSFKSRLYPSTSSKCPYCPNEDQNVEHIFLYCQTFAPQRAFHAISSLSNLWTSPLASIAYFRAVEGLL